MKSAGPDGIVLEFYKTFWHLIGSEYVEMICISININKFFYKITHGVLALLQKGGTCSALKN